MMRTWIISLRLVVISPTWADNVSIGEADADRVSLLPGFSLEEYGFAIPSEAWKFPTRHRFRQIIGSSFSTANY